MNLRITGGAGVLGARLARALLARGSRLDRSLATVEVHALAVGHVQSGRASTLTGSDPLPLTGN